MDLNRAFQDLPDNPDHPSDETLAAFAEGRGGEAVEVHLALCRRCTRLVADLVPEEKRSILPWAAAAAVLLAASLLLWPHAEKPTAPPVARILETSRELVLGESVHAVLRKGSKLSLSGPLTLEAGAILLDSPGEDVTLRAGDLRIAFRDAAVLVELLPSAKTSWLLDEAFAGEGTVRLKVLRGSVEVEEGGAKRLLKAGEGIGEPSTWTSPAWTSLKDGVIRESTLSLLPVPPREYVLEALLRKRSPQSEAGVIFAAGGKGWQIPLGGNLLPLREGWTRLRIEVRADACRITVGSRTALSRSVSELALEAWKETAQGVALKAWGGELEIREARWHP